MKKIYLLSLILLIGCVNMDEKLTNNTSKYPIIDVLNAYYENANDISYCSRLKDNSISSRPLRHYSPMSSKICFFNYKKYLPQNTDIQTEEDFLALAVMSYQGVCENSHRKDFCLKNREDRLQAYINGGRAKEKLEKERAKEKQKKAREKQEKDKKLAEEKKKKEKLAAEKKQKEKIFNGIIDCEQAIKQVLNKKPHKYACFSASCPETGPVLSGHSIGNNLSCLALNVSHEGVRVSDFSDKGVFVNNNKYFIYTDDTDYATDEALRNTKNVAFEKVGNYRYETVMGSQRAVPAYKASNIPITDFDIKTYLNDKTLGCVCLSNRNFPGELILGVSIHNKMYFFNKKDRQKVEELDGVLGLFYDLPPTVTEKYFKS